MRVLVDANVLYSRTLRDWLALLQLKSSGEVYTVYWTEDVLAETIYHLRRNNPTWNGARITAIRDLIARTFEGGRVDDFSIDESFPGSDTDDRHVHAAAVACRADFILTGDEGFFVADGDADSRPYEAYLPDEFFVLVDDSAPGLVEIVTREQTVYWTKRGHRADLADRLIAAKCPRFAERVRIHQGRLSLPG